MHLTAARIAFAATLFVGMGFALSARDNPSLPAIPPVPVAPTIPPPVPPSKHLIRFHTLVPGQEKGGNAEPNGKVEVAEPGVELSLGECIAIATDRHPQLRAVRESMAANQAGARGLDSVGTVGTLLSPDLEIRKQQAQRGLAAGTADYQRVHNEIVQDVTRLYYSAVYAKQQEAVAADVAGQLKSLIDIAWDILKTTPNPKDLEGLTRGKIMAMEIGLREAQGKEAEARIGRQRALAALRERMAVDEKTLPVRPKDAELPIMAQKVPITKDLVVEQALCRRPELALAAAGVDAFRLEVYAQGKIPFKRVVPTFASGSDLHSKEIPQAMRGQDYRPGGIQPELPPQLVGSKFERVCRAMAYSRRAEAVYDSARGLITLEAENAYLEFELATEKVRLGREKLDLALDIQKGARALNPKDKSIIVQAEVLASKTQADYTEAVFNHLLALAALERITAGGIRPAFPGR